MVRVNPPQRRSSTDLLVGAVWGGSCKQKLSRGLCTAGCPPPEATVWGPAPLCPPRWARLQPESPNRHGWQKRKKTIKPSSLLQTWENLGLDHDLLRSPALGQDPPEAHPEIQGQECTGQVRWWSSHRYAAPKSLAPKPEALSPPSSLAPSWTSSGISLQVTFRQRPPLTLWGLMRLLHWQPVTLLHYLNNSSTVSEVLFIYLHTYLCHPTGMSAHESTDLPSLFTAEPTAMSMVPAPGRCSVDIWWVSEWTLLLRKAHTFLLLLLLNLRVSANEPTYNRKRRTYGCRGRRRWGRDS